MSDDLLRTDDSVAVMAALGSDRVISPEALATIVGTSEADLATTVDSLTRYRLVRVNNTPFGMRIATTARGYRAWRDRLADLTAAARG